MMKFFNLTAMILVTFISTSCSEEKKYNDFVDDKLKAGQIWKYKTRPGEENSTLTILKLEKYDSVGVVVHIYVDGLKIKNEDTPSGFSEDIGHMPISKEALMKSVTTLVSENNKLPDFSEGYNIWSESFNKNESGIFSIEVSEAVKYMEETIREGQKTSN